MTNEGRKLARVLEDAGLVGFSTDGQGYALCMQEGRSVDDCIERAAQILAAAPTPTAEPRIESGGDALREALREITEAADDMLNSLPGHWHDDATIRLTDAANDARAAIQAAEQDDLYEPAALATPQAARPVGEDALREVCETLQAMIDAEVDYMTRNLLGDPERQHNVKRARAALAALASQPQEATGQGTGETLSRQDWFKIEHAAAHLRTMEMDQTADAVLKAGRIADAHAFRKALDRLATPRAPSNRRGGEVMADVKQALKAACDAHSNLNIFASIVTILEGGHIYGGNPRTDRALKKIRAISHAEQQSLLRDYDRGCARAIAASTDVEAP